MSDAVEHDSGSAIIICPCTPLDEFAPDDIIGVGFGGALLRRDGEVVVDGERYANCAAKIHDLSAGLVSPPEFLTGADAERLAAADPDHVWEIHLDAPLWERKYRRQPGGRWLCVHKGRGFA